MNPWQSVFLFAAAIAGGALNSVAAGGGFLTFPALLLTGMPPINANATSTAAMWPGTAASVAAYRNVIKGHRRLMLPLTISGICGGLAGAIVLLRTPQSTFMQLVPWLMLTATLLLVFHEPVTGWVARYSRGTASPKVLLATAAVQLGVAFYIGYFGPGAGLIMMALFAILGVQSIHSINGLKTMLATITNGMALLTFIVAGAIWWRHAALMIVGGALGGYSGAWIAQRINPRAVRWFAIGTGFTLTAYFFFKVFAARA